MVSASFRVGAWINDLQKKHMQPIMKIIETVQSSEIATKKEAHWIEHYTSSGRVLLNRGCGDAAEHSAAKRKQRTFGFQSRKWKKDEPRKRNRQLWGKECIVYQSTSP